MQGSFTATGRYYHPDYGYVDLSTPTAVEAGFTDTFDITSGVIVCTGAANTKSKLTVLDGDSFKVEADANSDGTYELDSGILDINDYE